MICYLSDQTSVSLSCRLHQGRDNFAFGGSYRRHIVNGHGIALRNSVWLLTAKGGI
jgi:hypothetical protein